MVPVAERPTDEPFATPGPRYSPVKFFHAVLFVLGGGLGLLWSWPGALLISFGLLAAYTVARRLLSPGNAGGLAHAWRNCRPT